MATVNVNWDIDYDVTDPVDGTSTITVAYSATPNPPVTGVTTMTGKIQMPRGPGLPATSIEQQIEIDLRSRLGVSNPTPDVTSNFDVVIPIDLP
jgi:hypothetical protein